MKEITIYVADDGTQFEDEFECREYELGLSLHDSGLTFYDENGEPVENAEVILDAETIFGLEIEDEKSLEILKNLNDWNGMYYDIDSTGRWKCVVELDVNGWFKERWRKVDEETIKEVEVI